VQLLVYVADMDLMAKDSLKVIFLSFEKAVKNIGLVMDQEKIVYM